VPQARLIPARNFKFDFYLPNRDMLIEFHGRQHYNGADYFGGREGFKLTRKRDRFKAAWAKANGYELITIKYTENVEDVLTHQLLTPRQLAA
jgi:very-short-patch-repair endonuclease